MFGKGTFVTYSNAVFQHSGAVRKKPGIPNEGRMCPCLVGSWLYRNNW